MRWASSWRLPVAILMAWYKPVRYIIEPWIQFIRNIPPLAYVPLIVTPRASGRKPQVIVITIAALPHHVRHHLSGRYQRR